AASGRNAGFLLAGVAENFIAAAHRYGEQGALRIWRFTRRTQWLVRALVEEHDIDCALRWNGSDQIAGDDGEWREIEASARRLSSESVGVSVDAPTRSATYAEDGELHPVRWVRGLAAAAVKKGARIHESTRVIGVGPGEARTATGLVRAGAIVLCTNAYTARLAPSRVRPVGGQMLATAPAPRVFARPAYANRGYRYWRQTSDGRARCHTSRRRPLRSVALTSLGCADPRRTREARDVRNGRQLTRQRREPRRDWKGTRARFGPADDRRHRRADRVRVRQSLPVHQLDH